jgi:hypothetical protein
MQSFQGESSVRGHSADDLAASTLAPLVSNVPGVGVSATSMGVSAFLHHHYGEALNVFREPHLLLLG